MQTITQGAYPYTEDLLALERISQHRPGQAPQVLEDATISTPLVLTRWSEALADHPDKHLKEYLLRGIRHGFRIGCDPQQPLRSATSNMRSALENPKPVTDYLKNELQEGRIIGPFTKSQTFVTQVSRFGVIPKRHQPGKWRLILDLSFPRCHPIHGRLRLLGLRRY